MLWVCEGCTTRYSVGAPRCPHCGSTEYHEEGSMPKAHRDRPPTYEPDAATVVADEVFESALNGSVFEPLTPAVEGEQEERVSEPAKPDDSEQAEESGVGGLPPAQLEDFSKSDLQSMASERKLPTSGTKAELIDRIREHDEAAKYGLEG